MASKAEDRGFAPLMFSKFMCDVRSEIYYDIYGEAKHRGNLHNLRPIQWFVCSSQSALRPAPMGTTAQALKGGCAQ